MDTVGGATRPAGGRRAGVRLRSDLMRGNVVNAPAAIRVLLVDDDPLVRSGLRLMFGGAPDIEVVAEAADGGEVLALVDAHAPDVVLMDIRMPVVDGLAATE